MKLLANYAVLFIILVVLGFLYKRFEEKRLIEENTDDYYSIRNFLLDEKTLADSKKPILWLHIPYEYNAREWSSFGSRNSRELNQPYLYLTIKTIIKKCEDSFTICIIDDQSFKRLIPGWDINMKKITNPILENIRKMGMMKLLYNYGGMFVPISFLCMKNLSGLYETGTSNNKMFLCENNNTNITSTTFNFYPDLYFSGANKENETVGNLIDFMQRTISTDYTSQSVFLGDFDRWCENKIRQGKINMINGINIGVKTEDESPIKIDDLMSQNYIKLYPQTYGILIPSNEILKRRNYAWFASLSEKEVLHSNTIIGNYILVNSKTTKKNKIKNKNVKNNSNSIYERDSSDDERDSDETNRSGNLLAPVEVKPKKWVGFWKVPNYNGLYGQKPNFLGDNLLQVSNPGL